MTSLMIGRWQPLHEGHKKLINTVLDEGNNVVIGIRDITLGERNPYSFSERVEMFKEAFGSKVQCIRIPEGEEGLEVIYGRKVGWNIREIRLDKDTEQISGTKVRETFGE